MFFQEENSQIMFLPSRRK